MKNNLLHLLKWKVQEVSRKKKMDFFYKMYGEKMNVLDVGVFPETTDPYGSGAVNYFTKTFRYSPEQYTGLSIDSMKDMDKLYPGKRFLEYNGGRFPFMDKEFDWALSNAVIEHVGNYGAKLHFINEMVRVSKNVFFTTPNKFFPIDAHTMLMFVHWNDKMFLNWRKKHNRWMPESALNLISYRELKRLLKESDAENFKIIKNRVLGLTMTFTVVINCN